MQLNIQNEENSPIYKFSVISLIALITALCTFELYISSNVTSLTAQYRDYKWPQGFDTNVIFVMRETVVGLSVFPVFALLAVLTVLVSLLFYHIDKNETFFAFSFAMVACCFIPFLISLHALYVLNTITDTNSIIIWNTIDSRFISYLYDVINIKPLIIGVYYFYQIIRIIYKNE